MKKEKSTEELILKAAEEVFIEKGYAAARTTEIAKRAGVNHGMLHYYYRTKEQLFDIVFRKQVDFLSDSAKHMLLSSQSFEDIISKIIENHFNMIQKNPRVLSFIATEVNNNTSCRQVWENSVKTTFLPLLDGLTKILQKEYGFGKIRETDPLNYLLTILSLNSFVFLIQPLFNNIASIKGLDWDDLLKRRRAENIRLALLSLKP